MLDRNYNKGFTLVELSIVLVIIGLLTGGILAAQSMITTAKINAFVRQIGQYDIAMSNFKTNYNQIPGDSNLFGGPGNNNGTLDPDGTNLFISTSEAGNFWTELQTVGLKDQGTFVTRASGALVVGGPTPHIPASKIGASGTGIMALYHMSTQNAIIALNGCYAVSNFTQNAGQPLNVGGTSAIFSVNSADAMAVDLKIDNGLSISGNMIAYGSTANVGSPPYDPSNSDLLFTLFIKYMAQTR
jgi:prepilin-type N-terminal cleavage/methylation domain-containing protein